ncbi:MAG: phosphoribosylformylglycinamidine synthase [Patescibacteria group bacterium]|jgi:phosphoribosylformylglycinamidine synthase
MSIVLRFFKLISETLEHCFYVALSRPLTAEETDRLETLLGAKWEPAKFDHESFFTSAQGQVVEVGPRLNAATKDSSNSVAICQICELTAVTRLERSRRYLIPPGVDAAVFAASRYDRMTEMVYIQPLKSFTLDIKREPTRVIPVLEQGPDALRQISRKLGLGWDEQDIAFYEDLFVRQLGRNPTDVELFQLAQMLSGHSRHHEFTGKWIIDDQEMTCSPMDLIRSTYEANPNYSIIAFHDNSSAILGEAAPIFRPEYPGQPSSFIILPLWLLHPLLTAETHNFPSGVSPYPGSATGTNGRERDGDATGRGSLLLFGACGFCVADLHLPGYVIPGEHQDKPHPSNLASPLEILLGMMAGGFGFGTEFGEPVPLGFSRTCDLRLPNGQRVAWFKPVMYTFGAGFLPAEQKDKEPPQKGMIVVQIGGPAYRIGVGGGAASSQGQGDQSAQLDFNAVQRGDAQMAQRGWRVIRACVEMGERNPIASIHDQGAGGPANVLTELVTPAGARLHLSRINLGDPTLSELEVWSAEYQERHGLLIWPDRLAEFIFLCAREGAPCEVLGEITGDGRITVVGLDGESTPVDLPLANILENLPRKTFKDRTVAWPLESLRLPPNLTVSEAVQMVWQLLAVGSKGAQVNHVDRSVTGLIIQQQCVGVHQVAVADCAIAAQDMFAQSGLVTSLGEQPIVGLVSPEAMARLAVAEAVLNLCGARTKGLETVGATINWMWPVKRPGEGARFWRTIKALVAALKAVNVPCIGGKDSSSMYAKGDDGEIVNCPGQVVVGLCAPISDVENYVTPEISGGSILLLVDLSDGKNRLGGSALAQALDGQIGDEAPDVNMALVGLTVDFTLALLDENLLQACHDVSDGGLITTVCEMAMAGNCGCLLDLSGSDGALATLFSQEPRLVLAVLPESMKRVRELATKHGLELAVREIGTTTIEPEVAIDYNNEEVLNESVTTLLSWFNRTSDRLEQEQIGSECAEQQARAHGQSALINLGLSFEPTATAPEILIATDKPKVAIIRAEGTNGDRELAAAFMATGFDPIDVNMKDLLAGKFDLDCCRGLGFPGGFSYADVLGSAMGWAMMIRFHPKLQEMFDRFYYRTDTFSFSPCNGCQNDGLLGWVPWRGLPDHEQPRFTYNLSGKFESRFVAVEILDSPAIMLRGMAGSRLGVWVAHGEGRLLVPSASVMDDIWRQQLVPLVYLGPDNGPTEMYPFNPNGSPYGIAGLCDPTGRHLAMMPHPERGWQLRQWPYLPRSWSRLPASPWLWMFQNARIWCDETA